MSRCRTLLLACLMVVIGGCDGPNELAEPNSSTRPDLLFELPLEAGSKKNLRLPSGDRPSAMASTSALSEPCEDPMDPECSTDDMTDAEILQAWPAQILTMWSTGSLTSTYAHSNGYTRFIGTDGEMQTTMQMYYLGNLIATPSDNDSYVNTVWDDVREALGACSASESPPDPPGCPHEMQTEVEAYVGRPCGNRIVISSKHRAYDIWLGHVWSDTRWQNSPAVTRSQPPCPPEDEPEDPPLECDDPSSCEDDGGSGGSGGGGSDTCEWYTCETWYWYNPDTGEIYEIIGTWCYCSG